MISSAGGIFGIIGERLTHSLTPRLMNHLAVRFNRPEHFDGIEISEQELPGFFEQLERSPKVFLNVTSPFKERVIEYLENISGDAQDANSVNIIVGGQGRLKGYNADIEGFMSPSDFLSEIKWENEKLNTPPTALILGSGGAASAATVGLIRAWGIGRLVFLARDSARLQLRVEHFQRRYIESHFEFFASGSLDEARTELSRNGDSIRLLINATPVGQWPDAYADPFEPFGMTDEDLGEFAYFYDAVYNPVNTAAMKRLSSLGAKVIGGVDWFCRQAVLSAEIFFDQRPSEDEVRRFVETELLKA